jgi:hypothetical protein
MIDDNKNFKYYFKFYLFEIIIYNPLQMPES